MKPQKLLIAAFFCSVSFISAKAQYVQAERDDTVRIYAKTPFDKISAQKALEPGHSTVKGVAFTRPKTKLGYGAPFEKRILANKIKVYLFPVTSYLTEYLELKKKENVKKLRIVYIDPEAWKTKYIAITNSVGEFTFPNLKPGKYYLEAILPWDQTGSYNKYTGTGYGTYSTVDYYERKYYNIAHYDKLDLFVDIERDGGIIEVKLK